MVPEREVVVCSADEGQQAETAVQSSTSFLFWHHMVYFVHDPLMKSTSFQHEVAGLAVATRHHSSCPTSLDKPGWLEKTRELHYVSCWINPIAEQHTLNVGFMSDKCRAIMFKPGDPLVHCDSQEAVALNLLNLATYYILW